MFRLRTILPIILIGVSLLLAYFYIKPMYFDIMGVRDKKTAVEDALQKTRDIGNTINEIQSQISSIPDFDINKMDAILPNKIDEVRYLDMVSTLASSYNFPISGLKIDGLQSPAKLNPISTPNGTVIASTIKTINISFSVKASYEKFKDFLREIERSLVLFNVQSIDMDNSATKTSKGVTDDKKVYNYTIKLVTYLKE